MHSVDPGQLVYAFVGVQHDTENYVISVIDHVPVNLATTRPHGMF